MNKSTKHGFWYGFNIAALILIGIFLFCIPLLFALADFVRSVDFAMTQTESVTVHTPTTITIDISNPDHTALNAVEFELSYDPHMLAVTSIVPHSILCEEQFVITNTFNNASGTALFQCGTLTPFTGNNGTVATLHVLPLKTGASSITFGELTHTIVHDGLGTDATANRTDLVFSTL